MRARNRWYVIDNCKRGASCGSYRWAWLAEFVCRRIGACDIYRPVEHWHR